tara:strand:- start:802 stop:1050 length:249 start_codon:yes stop_codon:yes gene_type:complete
MQKHTLAFKNEESATVTKALLDSQSVKYETPSPDSKIISIYCLQAQADGNAISLAVRPENLENPVQLSILLKNVVAAVSQAE